MKNKLMIITLMLAVLFLSGCKTDFLPLRHEIDDLQLVQLVGVDISEDGNPMITIASKRMDDRDDSDQQGNNGGSSGSSERAKGKAQIQTSEGKTVFDAVRNTRTHGDKVVFWGHTKYYLIGEEAAKESIIKYFDFFTRDHELRIESMIYIVKGSTAKELIEEINKTEYFIVDKLDSLGKNIKLLSTSEEMKVSDLMRFIDIHHGSARLPCIELVCRDNEEGKTPIGIDICGYAVIADLKLVGYIGLDISRGLNLITNNVKSSIVAVKDLLGRDASLEIIESNTEVIPKFVGDELTDVTVKTVVQSNLGEIQSLADISEEASIHYMESQQSEILENEIKQVIDQILKSKSDCLNICDKIRMRRPLKWRRIEDQWMQIFPKIHYAIQVKSIIERTYEVKEPSGYQGKE